jgi:hypothetical protein
MCNSIIFNEILVFYASYVCLLHSCFVKNHPIRNLVDKHLISEAVLSQVSTPKIRSLADLSNHMP